MKHKIILFIILLLLLITGIYFYTAINVTAPEVNNESTTATSTLVSDVELPLCNDITIDETYSKKILLPITCRGEIGKGETPVRVDIIATSTSEGFENGEVYISRDGKKIFELGTTEDNYAEVIGFTLDGEAPELRQNSFIFKDVTYDGLNDIAVLSSGGAYNFTTTYYGYNPATKTFNPKPILEATNESFNEADKTVSSFYKGRGIGDLYSLETLQLMNGEYVLVKRVSQDAIDFENLEKGYELITEELRDGKMVETKREFIPYNEVWDEEEVSE